MSAIIRLRDIVATHSNAEAILWSRAEFVAVLQEIDDLQDALEKGWAERERLRSELLGAASKLEELQAALKEWEAGTRYTRGGEAERLRSLGWTDSPIPLLLKGEPRIELTPAQLVQIIKEAGK